MIDRDQLYREVSELRDDVVAWTKPHEAKIFACDARHRDSLRNFLHYLALRQRDLRPLQRELAESGLSSLGRSESDVLDSLSAVLGWLEKGRDASPTPLHAGWEKARERLATNTRELFGERPAGRHVGIMVTAPSPEIASAEWMDRLLSAGMNCLRINCSHGDRFEWDTLASRLREATQRTGRSCRLLMDLAGPKIRTIAFGSGPRVVRYKPRKDDYGRIPEPLKLALRAAPSVPARPPTPETLFVPAGWLPRLARGTHIQVRDARGKKRTIVVNKAAPDHAEALLPKTMYLSSSSVLRLEGGARARCPWIAPLPRKIVVPPGDRFLLTRTPRARAPGGKGLPRLGCTLPEVFEAVRVGERVFFDDGKISCRATRVGHAYVELEVVGSRKQQAVLRGEMGMNLPDTDLPVATLSDKDLEDLTFIAKNADMVALSFVRGAEDVRALMEHLGKAKRELGVVLKIETRRGFRHLPEILIEAIGKRPLGIMIARGDLAVECGFERLAEVQEEILWLSEAAHLPVIWATQVLETLAKTGFPSRAEVTDAAMSVRAECVMLNKGPFIEEAVRCLDEILRRMEAHQDKKRQLFRRLSISSDFAKSDIPATSRLRGDSSENGLGPFRSPQW